MKPTLLLPYGFKKIGWMLLTPTLIYGAYLTIVAPLTNGPDFEESAKAIFRLLGLPNKTIANGFLGSFTLAEAIQNNILIFGIVLGSLFIGCSREKIEDEMIGRIRHDSLLIALWANYIILLTTALFIYGIDFLNIMLYNLFTMLLIFLAVFRYKLWQLRKEARGEE